MIGSFEYLVAGLQGREVTVWYKSSYSNPSGNCVEAEQRPGEMGVRDSKDPKGPQLSFSAAAWAEFINGLKGA